MELHKGDKARVTSNDTSFHGFSAGDVVEYVGTDKVGAVFVNEAGLVQGLRPPHYTWMAGAAEVRRHSLAFDLIATLKRHGYTYSDEVTHRPDGEGSEYTGPDGRVEMFIFSADEAAT